MNRFAGVASTFVVSGMAFAQLPANVIAVRAGAAPGGDGSSWASAFNDLQPALVAAAALLTTQSTVQVWIAEGTYTPSAPTLVGEPRSATFTLVDRVSVYGGFAGTETSRTQRVPSLHPTVLSGVLSATDRAWHVVTGTGIGFSTELGEVTVSGGQSTSSPTDPNGGGLLLRSSNCVLRNCMITSNGATSGGGIFCDGGSPTLVGCTISNNFALDGHGGATFVSGSPFLSDCVIRSNNSALHGTGGVCVSGGNSFFQRCTITGNIGGTLGPSGGLFLSQSAYLVDCTLSSNSHGNLSSAGATYCVDATLVRCDFDGSSANEGGGGGVWGRNLVIQQCSFTGNRAAGAAAILGAQVRASDCTFAANSWNGAASGGAGCLVTSDTSTFERCSFTGSTSNAGPGVASVTRTTFNRCTFSGNSSTRAGVMSLSGPDNLLVNCTFGGNTGEQAGVIQIQGDARIINCNVVGNTTNRGTLLGNGAIRVDSGAVMIANCIVWGNATSDGGPSEAANIVVKGGTLAPSYNCIQGLTGALGGTGNIADDPLFGSGYNLLPGSPCIDTGDDFAVPFGILTDAAGAARFFGSPAAGGNGPAPRVDRGAYEFGSVVGTSCYANLDQSTGSPLLTASDFAAFLSLFRAGHPLANCDNSSGAPLLSAADFTCFLNAFRAGCP